MPMAGACSEAACIDKLLVRFLYVLLIVVDDDGGGNRRLKSSRKSEAA